MIAPENISILLVILEIVILFISFHFDLTYVVCLLKCKLISKLYNTAAVMNQVCILSRNLSKTKIK